MSDVVIIGAGIHPFGRFDKTTGSWAPTLRQRRRVRSRMVESGGLPVAYLHGLRARASRRLGSTDISIVDIKRLRQRGRRSAGRCSRCARAMTSRSCSVRKDARGYGPSMIYSAWQIELGMSQSAYWSMRAGGTCRYGTTERQIAKVNKNHRNSVHNANAMYRKNFRLRIRLPLVCDPIGGSKSARRTMARPRWWSLAERAQAGRGQSHTDRGLLP
jgi:hypothetical protein